MRIKRNVKGEDGNIGVYQVGTDAAEAEVYKFCGEFAGDGLTAQT